MAATHSSRAADPFMPRNFWLAGLGLASVARREAGHALRNATGEACRLRGNAIAFAGDLRDIARGAALTLRERIEPRVAAMIPRIDARIAPIMSGSGRARPTRRRSPARARKAASPRRVRATARGRR